MSYDQRRTPQRSQLASSSREPSPSARSRGPPAHPQTQMFQTQTQPFALPGSQSYTGVSTSALEPGSIVPIRPAFARHNTDVKIREDGPIRQPSGDDVVTSDSRSEDGITLADIPHILEVEQAREQHRPLAHEGARCLSELSALELFIVKHMAVMYLQQSALREHVNLDDLIEFIETRKNTFWGKIFKGGKEKKEVKKKGIFGIPLDILIERNGADSTLGVSAAHLRVPTFIDDVISAMKQMDLSVEGIFRKNGNIRRLKELSESLDRDSSAVNLLDDNPVQLAALLKKFLRELPDPLMTFKLHKLFVMSQKLESEPERRRILHLVTVLLPKGHRDTMEVLFAFLKWVASFSHIDEETGSKMDLPNLATVICPNILYSKGSDPTKDETFLANRAVSYLLEHQDDFWKVPEELEAVLYDKDLLNSSADLTSRDILKKCEKYARMRSQRGAGGGPGLGFGSGGPLQAGEMQNRHRPDVHPPTTMRQVHQREQQMQGQPRPPGGNGAPPISNGGGGYSRSPERSGGTHWPPSSQPPVGGSASYGPPQPFAHAFGSNDAAARSTGALDAPPGRSPRQMSTPTTSTPPAFASQQQQQQPSPSDFTAYGGYHRHAAGGANNTPLQQKSL